MKTIIRASAATLLALAIANGGAEARNSGPPVPIGPCGQVAANSARFSRWVKRTRVDQSDYAMTMRENIGMAAGDSATVVPVSDSTTCAALALTFARSVAGRDTVSPNPVYVLAVDSTQYLLVDFRIDSQKQADSVQIGSASYYGPSYTYGLTVFRATGETKKWVFDLLSPVSTPY